MSGSMFKKLFYPLLWVMDVRISPLRHLRPAQRFQIMCLLGTMWTFIFCVSAGAWLHYGFLLAVHALFALGALITGLTFYYASSSRRSMTSSSRRDD